MKHLMNGFYVEMTPRLSGVDFSLFTCSVSVSNLFPLAYV